MVKKDKNVKGGYPVQIPSRTNQLAKDPSAINNCYICTGNFPSDFVELWNKSDLDKIGIPVIKAREKPPKIPEETKENNGDPEDNEVETPAEDIVTTYTTKENFILFKPSIQCEFDVEETRQSQTNYVKEMYIRGWKLEEKIIQIITQCVLDRLTTINLWNAGINELTITTLATSLKSIPTIRTLVLEGNPIVDTEPFSLLLSQESTLLNLSLRSNRITSKGAKLISDALSGTPRCGIINLNLSFNEIGNDGAKYLAQALRTNRVLLSLSLSSNYISDEGCIAIASSLKTFTLTHDEIVQRRKLLSDINNTSRKGFLVRPNESRDRPGSNRSGTTGRLTKGSSKKGKPDVNTKKGDIIEKNKKEKRSSNVTDLSRIQGKGKRSGIRDGSKVVKGSHIVDQDDNDNDDVVHAMLDSKIQVANGKIYLPGCLSLVNLNLSRNEIGEAGLNEVYAAVQYQKAVTRISKGYKRNPGLLKLNLQKNYFSEKNQKYLNIQYYLMSRDPLTASTEDEQASTT